MLQAINNASQKLNEKKEQNIKTGANQEAFIYKNN